MQKMQKMQFDIVINGAGMVGSSLAIGLADAGFSVLLIENQNIKSLYPKEDYGARVSAFNLSSKKWFEYLNVWDKIKTSGRICPFSNMYLWNDSAASTNSAALKFNANDGKHDYLGWIIDNAVVQGSILDVAQNHSNITVFDETCLSSFQYLESSESSECLEYSLELLLKLHKKNTQTHEQNQEQTITCQCKLLVGADGGNSLVRDWAGISSIGWSYGQKTIVGQVKPSLHHENTCWQKFLKNGPIALLPLADGRCSLALYTTHEEADYLLSLPLDEIGEQISSKFDYKFGEIIVENNLSAYPLRLNHAKSYVAKNIVIAGDAAHNIHPMAGLGVNIGFMDAAVLTEVLINSNSNKSDSTRNITVKALKTYEKRRKCHNIAVMGAMDVIQKTYKFDSLFADNLFMENFMGKLKNTSFYILNKLSPIKNQLINIALGVYGDLPKFLK